MDCASLFPGGGAAFYMDLAHRHERDAELDPPREGACRPAIHLHRRGNGAAHRQRPLALRFTSIDAEMERRIDSDPFFDGDAADRALSKAVAKLPEKQRQVFILRYYDEMPYEQMSEVLETSVGALKASYHIAQEKVRSALGKDIFIGSD